MAGPNTNGSSFHNMKRQTKGLESEAHPKVVEQFQAELALAESRITTLESELRDNREAIFRLLADDVRNSEEIVQLKEMVWSSHRGLPDGCECDVCLEVEQSRTELGGLF